MSSTNATTTLLTSIITTIATTTANLEGGLPGVTLLSDLALQNLNVTGVEKGIVDESSDLSAFLVVGIPILGLFVLGVGFVAYNTDDDGYLSGVRRVESVVPRLRIFQSFLIYLVEGAQLIFVLFTPATVAALPTDVFLHPAKVWLFNGDLETTFPVVLAFQLLWTIFFVIPLVLWFTLKRETFKRIIEQYYTTGVTGIIISFFQDCFMVWLPLPMIIQILRPIPCTYYLDDTPSSALDGTTTCLSSKHTTDIIVAAIVFVLTFSVGVTAGAVPSLVGRYGDLAINGRYMSISFAMKALMATVYTVTSERHVFYHLGCFMGLQVALFIMSITMRPSLVERINFHRSAIFACTLSVNAMLFVAAALDDPVTALPFVTGFIGLALAISMIITKYYFLSCGKLFPEIVVNYVDGTTPSYEGDICLGRNLPHGHGRLRWEDKTFTGKFYFGKEHGYGVLTLGKYFYEGFFKAGVRGGFGMTNMMFVLEKHEDDGEYSLHEDPGAESYEGFWVANVHEGEGTKKFRDGDRFDGTFRNGNEHGMGTWTCVCGEGVHVVRGEWEDGIFVAGLIDPNEQEYEGDLRYGVPHGTGTMHIGDDLFEGEWRAGKMHGFGIVRMQEGEYEGNFFEGLYHDEGKWSDEHGVYIGKFKEGQKHGHGVEETADGTFEGNFDRGMRHGYGTFRYNETEYYQGSWKRNEYHGSGLLVTEDFEYDGQWVDGRKEGPRGHIRFSNGIEYVGGWIDDKFHEQGRLRIPGLGEYQGKFNEGNKVGTGRFTFYDGSVYVGEWHHDLADGTGTFTFSSRKALMLLGTMNPDDRNVSLEPNFLDVGGEIKGSFFEGEINGEGRANCSDGTKYSGEWRASLPHGQGEILFPNGGVYTGEWSNGVREGIGRMTYPDKRIYEGEWKNNKRHGTGVLYAPNGVEVRNCEWLLDAPVINAHKADKTSATLNLHELPVVDVDELLRALMPNQFTPEEVEEGRFRKRVELEEQHVRSSIMVYLEEELIYNRLLKNHYIQQHAAFKNDLQREQTEEHVALQRTTLAKVLNLWKQIFREENGRDPKKSDLVKSSIIGPVYRRYMELAEER